MSEALIVNAEVRALSASCAQPHCGETPERQCLKRTYTFGPDALHTLQRVQSGRNERARAFLLPVSSG
jgi:hypothetical protein